MRKIFKSLFVGTLSALALTACANSEVTNDTLVIGMECAYQPFNWTLNNATDNTLPIFGTNQYADGYDISIAKYLSEATGKEVEIHKLEWGGLIPALQSGEINMVLAGMTDTPERRQSIDFTVPYLTSDLAFLISTENLETYFPGNSAENPATYEELLTAFSNKTLVCQSSVVGDDFITTYFEGKNGIIHAAPLDTYPAAANDVKAGIAFAMPAELPVCEAMVNLGGLSVLYVDYSFLSDEDKNGLSVSIGVKKGNQELIDELNEALSKLTTEQRQEMMGAAATRSADSIN